MDLPSSVVKKFVELTKEPESTTGHYVYGTAIVNGDEKYVQVDGSESLTSVSIATDIATGDRVLLYIENHTASVIGNVTCPASGRGAIDVSDMLQDFETLVVGDLYAITETVETIYANYVSTDYLETYYFTAEYIVGNYLLADKASLTYATIDSLDAESARITELESSQITTEYLEANYASIIDLDAVRAQIKELDAEYAKIDWVDATFATIEDLLAYEAYIYYLDVDIADIKSLLAGVAGVGELEAIHLTVDNVVIEGAIITDAAIAYVSADKITSGTIYTKYVQIADDENKRLWIDGGTIQLIDTNDIVRVQIGEDNLGDYNLYLWDDLGTLIWNPKGLTEEGLTGNGAIIKNAAVDDNAAIAGYKLDIDSVVSELNSNGTLVVNAAHVQVDDNTLDYTLSQIQTQIQGLEGVTTDGLISWTAYFALGSSDTEPPINNDDVVPALTDVALTDYSFTDVYESDVVPALTDVALTDYSYTDVYEVSSTLWTISQPQQEDGLYLWMRYYCTYADGHTEWSTPILLTDSYLRNNTSDLMTQLKVIQGDISAKVWLSDINESISDLWAEIDVSIGDVLIEVGSLVDENTKYLESEIARIDIQSDNISLTVEGIKNSVDNIEENYVTKASLVLQINEQTGYAELIGDADYIYFYGNQIVIDSDNFVLTEDGSAYLRGTIESSNGHIGNWIIGENKIYNDLSIYSRTAVMQAPYDDSEYVFACGGYSHNNYEDCPYRVTKDGKLYSEDAEISGTISAKNIFVNYSYDTYYGDVPMVHQMWIGSGNAYTISDGNIQENGTIGLFARDSVNSYEPEQLYITSRIIINALSDFPGNSDNLGKQYSYNVNYGIRLLTAEKTQWNTDGYINVSYIDMLPEYIKISSNNFKVSASSGSITITSSTSESAVQVLCTHYNGIMVSLQVGSGGTNRGIYDNTLGNWIIYRNSSSDNTTVIPGTITNLTTSGNIYAGTTSGTSAIYSYCRSSYGSIALYVATDTSRGLRDLTTNSWMIAYNTSNVLYIGNTSYQSTLRGSSISITGAVTANSNITIEKSSGNAVLAFNATGQSRNLQVGIGSGGNKGLYDSDKSFWFCYLNTSNYVYIGNESFNRLYLRAGSGVYSSFTVTVDSDVQLKTDIAPLNSNYDELFDNLSPVIFRYISGGGKSMGFIYQDVKKALGDANLDEEDHHLISTYEDEEGHTYGGIAYSEIIALLVYEVQNLKSQIKQMQN